MSGPDCEKCGEHFMSCRCNTHPIEINITEKEASQISGLKKGDLYCFRDTQYIYMGVGKFRRWMPQAEGQWISVKDRLPDECENVLIWKKGFSPITGFLVYELEGRPLCYQIEDWDESEMTIRLDEITHWMPLPEPPKTSDIEQDKENT